MQPLLAALDQGAQRGALSGIADVQGRRHACCCHVVDGLQASSGGAHGFSRGEGGLEGLSLLRLFKGLRELRSVARRRSRRQCAHGQRAACRVVAVWLMAFKQAALGGAAGAMVSEHSRAACCRVVDGPKQWWYGFGSGLSGLFSPRLIGKVSGCSLWRPTALSAAVADGA